MNCSEAIPLIHEYLDGNISRSDLVQLNKHLLHCPECKGHFDRLQKTEALISGCYPDVRCPEYLKEKIMAALPKQRRDKRWGSWIRKHPGVFVAALFTLIAGSYLVTWGGEKNLIVKGSGLEQVVIQGDKVIVPEGAVVRGDLFVEDGTTEIRGEVKGNLVVVNGNVNLASTAHISGEVTKINQALEWIWYKLHHWLDSLTE